MSDGHVSYDIKDLFERIDRKLDVIGITLDKKVDVETFHLAFERLEKRVSRNEEAVNQFKAWRSSAAVLVTALVFAVNVAVVFAIKFV